MKNLLSYLLTTIQVIVVLLSLFGCGEGTVYIPGPPGKPGIDGKDGAKGDKGDQGIPGLQGIQGIVGSQGIQGVVGPQGVQGLIGPAGIQGIPGSPGTLVTFIKFCAQVDNYPSTFPEYGLCVGNEIYAVYSANGGFGMKVVPGTYSSNAINSACNFTVATNCVVTH